MYLFSRTRTADPTRIPEAQAWAVEVAAHVTKAVGKTITPWTSVYGLPTGTFSWSGRVESHAEMGALQEKLALDTGYATLLAKATTLFVGPVEDAFVEFVASAGTPGPARYATLVRAECAGGHMAEAFGWGVDTMHHVNKITGLSISMVRSLYGQWGGIGWITGAESLDDIDNAQKAMSADAGYVERLDMAGDFFADRSASTVLIRNIS
jgi:hypothetical protein